MLPPCNARRYALGMAHEPIQFVRHGRAGGGDPQGQTDLRPRSLDLEKDRALTVRWSDGRVSIYPITLLRRLSPSADAKVLREQISHNPLTVLPSGGGGGKLTATGAELVGNYAIRVRFSDGHDTGIYSWAYLRSIDPNHPGGPQADPGAGTGPGED